MAALSGGGNQNVIATKHTSGELADTSGGDITANVHTQRHSTISIIGGGSLDLLTFKGASTAIALTTGGDISVVPVRTSYAQLVVTGGGQMESTGLRFVAGQWTITGGGHLYGPWPIVLHPRMSVRANNAAVATKQHIGNVIVLDNRGRVARPVYDRTSLTR